MSKKTTEQINKLIAEFMGLNVLNREEYEKKKYTVENAWEIGALSYHWDWNKLMPVVEKIETISTPENKEVKFLFKWGKTQVTIGLDNTYLYNHELSCISGRNRLEATYKAVLAFIEWYNKNNH